MTKNLTLFGFNLRQLSLWCGLAIVAAVLSAPTGALGEEPPPPVKKSRSGICHDAKSPWYATTTQFEAFETLKKCIDSGGRLPKGAGAPPQAIVKKSKSGICHDSSSPYYGQTTNYEPFNSMADCIASGGRRPK